MGQGFVLCPALGLKLSSFPYIIAEKTSRASVNSPALFFFSAALYSALVQAGIKAPLQSGGHNAVADLYFRLA